MGSPSQIHTLLLYLDPGATHSYYDDWRDAFLSFPGFGVDALNIFLPGAGGRVRRRVREYDLIVLLHSTNADTLRYLGPLVPALNRRKGILLSLVGNEVSLPGCWLSDKLALLGRLQPELIGTQLPIESGRYLYEPIRGSRVVALAHALNPQRYAPVTPQAQRAIDVGVRCFRYHPMLGDNERNAVVDYFRRTAFVPPLVTDIATEPEARMEREVWARFLDSCKATVSTEAGTYYLERDDATVRGIMEYLRRRRGARQAAYDAIRGSWLRRAVPRAARQKLKLLLGATSTEQAYRAYCSHVGEEVPFEEIHARFFKDYRNPVSGKCISSRHFDAVGTKTLQVMFPGAFNGILEADRHYVSLARDFSNIADVLKRLRDADFRRTMTDTAYEHVLAHHTYEHRLRAIFRYVAGGNFGPDSAAALGGSSCAA